MSCIDELPTEILLTIVDYLDATSLNTLYIAYDRIQRIVRENTVLQKCDLSYGRISIAQTLKTVFFKDISGYIQELNLRALKDLNKSLLMSAVKRMNNLKSLDVSYTNITILDFIDIYQVCSTIVDITINFVFSCTVYVSYNILIRCQKVFKNIESVHFIGNKSNLMCSELPLFILNTAKLRSLQYTVSDKLAFTVYSSEEFNNTLNFEEFIFNSNKEECLYILSDLIFFSKLKLEDYEAIFICEYPDSPGITFIVSPNLCQFMKEHFACYKIGCIMAEGCITTSCFGVMFWRKNSIQFNDNFYKRLFMKLKTKYPWYFKSKSSVPLDHSWFSTSPYQDPGAIVDRQTDLQIKRHRQAPPSYVLNYDEEFHKKERIELTINFNANIHAVSLSANCNYLRKLTSLFLCGTVRYSADFFNILFRCCTQLVTFSIESLAQSSSVVKSLPLSQTLKNISIIDKDMDLALLFSFMSQCRTLEVVSIYDGSGQEIKFADPSVMLQNCKNMCCLIVNLSPTAPLKNTKMLKQACKVSQITHLKTNLFDKSLYHIPCLDVFKCCY